MSSPAATHHDLLLQLAVSSDSLTLSPSPPLTTHLDLLLQLAASHQRHHLLLSLAHARVHLYHHQPLKGGSSGSGISNGIITSGSISRRHVWDKGLHVQ